MTFLVARIFSLHPDVVRRTITLRQAIAYIGYETDVLKGKVSILKEPAPETVAKTKARLRQEAMQFFMHHQEDEDGTPLRSGDPRDG